MLQSTKVDVIYFTTPTDFEMEFNLGGCCRMRLLTDSADNRKDFVQKLSRAVSRSQVIICCGPLFDEGGLIAGVAAAIGKEIAPVDKAAFGIKSSAEISVIAGALPLVQDGIFGGCVIESGPQTIILLTESHSVRKQLMTDLIHPYIEQIAGRQLAEKAEAKHASKPEPNPEPVDPAELLLAEAAQANADASEKAAAALPQQETACEPPENTAEESEQAVTEAPQAADNSPEPLLADPAAALLDGMPEVPGDNLTPEIKLNIEKDESDAAAAEKPSDLRFNFHTPPAPMPEMTIELSKSPLGGSVGFDGLFTESRDVRYDRRNYYNMCYDLEDQAMENGGEDGFSFDMPRRSLRIPILVFSIVLLVCLLILIYIFFITPLRQGISVGEYFELLFDGGQSLMRRML